MPVGYGGGIRTLADAERLFKIGIEKIVINTAACFSPQLIASIANKYGSQSVVVSVDVKKSIFGGRNKVYVHSQHKELKVSLREHLLRCQEYGAGEIILNSVDLDGTMAGYDLALVKECADCVDIPLIACGGAGNLSDLKSVVEAGASGAAAGSMFVFQGPHKAVLINYPGYKKIKEVFTQ